MVDDPWRINRNLTVQKDGESLILNVEDTTTNTFVLEKVHLQSLLLYLETIGMIEVKYLEQPRFMIKVK